MRFAIASLVLSAILMTQAVVDDIVSEVTNVEPLSEEILLFDVTSNAPVADLKEALGSASLKVRHSFHVLGTHQYFFVVVDDGSDALSKLRFPGDCLVTQYPVKNDEDFAKTVGVDGWNVSDTTKTLNDEDLVVVIREFVFPQGTSTSQMISMMKAMGSKYKKVQQISEPLNFPVLGRFPPKVYSFVNIDENSMQKVILGGLDTAGGPGNNVINVLRLGKV